MSWTQHQFAAPPPIQNSIPMHNQSYAGTPGAQTHGVTQIQALEGHNRDAIVRGIIVDLEEAKQITSRRNAEPLDLLGFVLSDATGTIKVTCWGEAAIKYSGELQIGQIVEISSGVLKLKQENTQYDITTSELCMSVFAQNDRTQNACTISVIDSYLSPQERAAYTRPAAGTATHVTPLAQVENMPQGTFVTLLALVATVDEVADVQTRRGATQRQSVTLYDQSGGAARLTLWGHTCATLGAQLYPRTVLFLMHARIDNPYRDLQQLTYAGPTCVLVNPQHSAATQLHNWSLSHAPPPSALGTTLVSAHGLDNAQFVKDTDIVDKYPLIALDRTVLSADQSLFGYSIASISTTNLGKPALPVYTKCSACNKSRSQNGMQCNNVECPQPYSDVEEVLRISFSLIDHTASLRDVACFGNNAETMIGVTLNELATYTQQQREAFDRTLLFKKVRFAFKLCGDGKLHVLGVRCLETLDQEELTACLTQGEHV